jgi:hypothetical protein
MWRASRNVISREREESGGRNGSNERTTLKKKARVLIGDVGDSKNRKKVI